ncbi:hypothetical protein IAR55_002153 [Kwoniella newhampshirensis]|uniref:Transcription initiation factor TFIID subunit 4 n=1 Tax=Kwoniella newhampshirensis TaxID=1651941 RepID=A0AAW0Z0Q0_9TREE
MQRAKGDGIDFRAEEDAARRLNVGRSINVNPSITGANSRAKRTDLIGKNALKAKVEAIAKDHGLSVDNDASLYLLAAIETRLRLLLSSSISAQTHRTNSSYLRQPPIRLSGKNKDEGKALWSHVITSDPSAVLDALNRANRDSEQEFRLSRMDRLAREAEMQKARGRAAAMAADPDSPASPLPFNGIGGGGEAGPSTPMSKPSPGSGSSSTPVFGAIRESTTPRSASGSAKKKGGSVRDVSAEVQHKMANAQAMRSVGMGKKYGWMMGNAPAISSPLAGGGKKRKAEKGKDKDKDKGKDRDKEASTTPGAANTPEAASSNDNPRPAKRSKPSITLPTRRLVPVLTVPSKDGEKEKEVEKKVTDDRVLTLVDLVFALEHGGLGAAIGQGIGSGASEVLQRVWARPGGPWGKEGWGDAKK